METLMRKYFIVAIFLPLILAYANTGISQVRLDKANLPRYVPGEILVKFKKSASKADIAQLNTRLSSKTIKTFPSIGVCHIKLKPGETVADAVEKYCSDPNVEYAEPNYIVHALATPNDPFFSQLWGLHNTGQIVNGTEGTADADIDAPEAWDITTGDSSVVIAVIDSGVAWDHPELVGNIWTNTGEIPGNGIDDDGNGYQDDIRGWDFLDNDNDPMDYHGHGTHVAGTIAGVGHNNGGITGVMWTARIMPLRFLDAAGFGNTADAIAAIDYAVENGARVMNNSWGGYESSQSLREAIERSNSANTVFVAAAGNDGLNNDSTPTYPASFPLGNIISVAATDQDDNLASFSNYGPASVDVGAPGVNTFSTVPAREVVFGDNFDDGTIAPWITGGTPDTWDVTTEISPPPSGTYCLTDSPGADYVERTNNWATSPPIDLSGRLACKLLYEMELDVEPNFDGIYIEASTDGSSWNEIVAWTGSTGGSFFSFEEDLTPYDGEPSLSVRFRLFESNNSGTADGAHIDDVLVTCFSSDYSAGTPYDYFQGTSMAAPHVSGLAGLLMAAFPGVSNSEVKTRILNGVDQKLDLAGRTVTGGRVNACDSLLIPPAPSNLIATAVSATRVDLRWMDRSSDELEFSIERKKEFGGAYSPIDTFPDVAGTGTTASYSDTTVIAGHFFHYRVRARNTHGYSLYSNEAMTLTPGGHFGLTGTGDGAGGDCFIATAAYGSPDGSSIDLLRAFRDEYLVTNPIGKKWVEFYYRYSPIMAGFIADHSIMRKGVRLILVPFVAFSAGMVHTTALQKGLIFCLILCLPLGMVVLSKRRTFNRHVLKR
jgi:subtilisin family serine protease